MLNKFLLLPFLFVAVINAQNLDSIYTHFIEIKTATTNISNRPVDSEHEVAKCGFSTVNFVRRNIEKFTTEQQAVLTQFLNRPETDTSFVSPSGKFRIHYDLSGDSKPSYSVNQLAIIMDSVYAFEVDYMGFPPPPADFNAGGDDRYDVYIQNQTFGVYGYTELEANITANTYTSFLVIDNDFLNYYSEGLNGVRVTAAHEFNHAIQLGNYIYRDSDTYYYEITSVAMEEFVFDYVNDYFAYLKTYFNNPNNCFSDYNYSMGIWNMYLKEKFGYPIIIRIWEHMRTKRAIEAISAAINENGSTFKDELNTFGTWTYFTGYRAKTGSYFKDALKFPLIKFITTLNYIPPIKTVTVNSIPASNNFVKFTSSNDTIASLITNADFVSAITNKNNRTSFDYSIQNSGDNGATLIEDGFYYLLSSGNNSIFCVANILNDSSSYNPSGETIGYVYPQPFSYNSNMDGYLHFPVKTNNTPEANLYIYNIGMSLVYNGVLNITNGTNPHIVWNGIGNNGKLASGVYIYITESDEETIKGKFVILND